ncbi:class I SAM-dependent methyltransferase [Mycetocola miduiensis]|uniref:Methyltransferase domain-containing protein n=1 Tax=Mycetocola miduiensis TaxID=995034 RepID=A0A1I4ZF81_9MICO|nr:class I SAM-dependent methyltransferase [Mycetocola miduiensis]SFN48922.1 Methyltransferase domain-containing protein [Mycetocola miduiensis]
MTDIPSSAPRSVDLRSGEWLDANRAHWDERVPIHVSSTFYDQEPLRAGAGRLPTVDEAELFRLFPGADGRFDLSGKRVLHLQCHFGTDSLTLAQRGASVVGLDFSMPAVREARKLAEELGLSDQSRFVASNLYDARHALPEPDSFDVIFTTWGTICWLPDIAEWARIIEWFLKPGGVLYFADSHPAAQVFDTDPERPDALPVFRFPYAQEAPDVYDEASDYADESAVLENTRGWEWAHPLSQTVGALLDAGLRLDRLAEHDDVPWRMYPHLVPVGNGMFGWPEEKWLPLSVSLVASKPVAAQS